MEFKKNVLSEPLIIREGIWDLMFCNWENASKDVEFPTAAPKAEKVSQDDYKKDLFHEFLLTYNAIAKLKL